MADDRLAIAVTHADGRVTRWGFDEVDGKNVPTDLTFGTKIPGGFDQMNCSLLRRLDQDHPDQGLFDNILVYGPGGRVAYEGRMQQFPRSHGSSYTITPGAVGWSAHLRDDPSFKAIIIDRDLTHWMGPTLTRMQTLTATTDNHPFQLRPDPLLDSPALATTLNGSWSRGSRSEAWYDAGPGHGIGQVLANFVTGSTVSFADANWVWRIFLSSDDNTTATDATADLSTAAAGGGIVTATGARRFAFFLQSYAVAAGGAGTDFPVYWKDVAVVGDHGLTLRTDGFYASDVIPYVLTDAAPLLTYSTGTDGSIEPTGFPIPHLVFRDPTTAEQAILLTNAHHLYDWGVYDGREFFYRQPDPDRLCWEARLGDGAEMQADGLTGEQVINGVYVTYTDPVGAQKTVGPPGGGFDATDAALEDASEDNPANSHGIPAKWDQLALSFTTKLGGATQIGAVYLRERQLATRRGSLTLTGSVQHPTEGKVPVWRVRAGDWIRVSDLNGENASVQRKIIETSYNHASRSITLNLDNTVAKLDAILARVGVRTGMMAGGGF